MSVWPTQRLHGFLTSTNAIDHNFSHTFSNSQYRHVVEIMFYQAAAKLFHQVEPPASKASKLQLGTGRHSPQLGVEPRKVFTE